MPAIAIPIGIGLGEAALWLAGALGITALGYGASKGGEYLANQMAEADRAADDAGTDSATDTCATCLPPECKDGADNVKQALYRNKRLPNANGGQHGYLNRMVEQMCGRSGPGTRSWDNHVDQLVGEQNKIRMGMENLGRAKCPLDQLFSRDERQAINNILQGGNGWTPQTIPWKGPYHPDCFNFGDKISSGRLRDFLNIIRPN